VSFLKNIVAALFILISTQVFAEPVAGQDYKLVNPPQQTNTGDKIEVLEFFFYGCGHCYTFHPHLTTWEKKAAKDVELVLIPTVFNASWEPMANTYYALEVMGLNHKLHNELYRLWNEDNKALTVEADIVEALAKQGVDSKKFTDAYHSFGVQSKVTRSKQMLQTFGIRGTPSVIVDGKYLITGLQPADTIKVMNALIDKARKDHAAGKR
jgi:thiol:disulfide interchange protein DsbA